MNNENTKLKVPRLETIKRTAEILNLPEFFVRTKVKNGEVVAVSAGRKTLVNVDKFIEYLNTTTVSDAASANSSTGSTSADTPTDVAAKLGLSPIPRR